MNIQGNKNRIFNLMLAKFFGFYQILDTETLTFLGRHNVHYRIFVLLIAFECLMSAMMCLNGLYYCINNIDESVLYFGFVVNMLYSSYKMYIVLNQPKLIWDCLSITQFDFTSYGLQDRRTLDVWRNRTIKSTNIFVIVNSLVIICFVVCPLVFSNTFIIMKNHDGSTSAYRLNVLNLYLFASEETYNTHFNMFYTIEAFGSVIFVLFMIIFDTIVNTLGFALCGQLQIISNAFESVGHKSHHSPNNDIDNKIKLRNEHINNISVYDDLKRLIIDHQSILKKYDEFLSKFGPTMLLQVFVLSYSIILLWFIFLMSLYEENFTESMAVITLKAGFAIPFCIYQMYMSCHMFETLHNKKDSIIFALYSCNWTEMDMKCKKLILLTMRMNNAHHQKLQYTRTKIINMEIFYHLAVGVLLSLIFLIQIFL